MKKKERRLPRKVALRRRTNAPTSSSLSLSLSLSSFRHSNVRRRRGGGQQQQKQQQETRADPINVGMNGLGEGERERERGTRRLVNHGVSHGRDPCFVSLPGRLFCDWERGRGRVRRTAGWADARSVYRTRPHPLSSAHRPREGEREGFRLSRFTSLLCLGLGSFGAR
ncbi:hypothetical protein IE53DRAFT_250905 [Violaceomyces palustris]|uniref:Uncharacterized protein n=1 Tax=Violaceomyces palustris TaxID=1673888 RepID=A0ACD0NNP5_9BASI|nr:hypothetical protein IE53DRAFT_250905 [Violaceomyces palustris]